MHAVTVAFEIYPAHVNAFREAVLAQARNSLDREEPCRRFDVCLDPKRPDRVFLYELYDTPAAFQAHLDEPPLQDLQRHRNPLDPPQTGGHLGSRRHRVTILARAERMGGIDPRIYDRAMD